MTKTAEDDYLNDWGIDGYDDRSAFNNDPDDPDDYISERSSIPSLDRNVPAPATAPVPKTNTNYNPEEYQDPYYYSTGEGAHTLRYFYNELPAGGVPDPTLAKETKEEEKRRRKEELQARRGQGALVAGPQTGAADPSDNYYPYWYYYKVKNPDWIMRQQQYADADYMPPIDRTKKIEPIDPEELPEVPKLTAATRKARQYQYSGRETPDMRYNHQKQRYEMVGRNGSRQGAETYNENNDKQGSTSKQYIPLKGGNDDGRLTQDGRQTRTGKRGKLNTEYDWTDHYAQYMRSRSSQEIDYKPKFSTRSHKKRNRNPLDGLYTDDPTPNENEPNSNVPNGKYKGNVYHNDSTSRSRRYKNRTSGPQSNQQQYNNSSDPRSNDYSGPQSNDYSGPRSNKQRYNTSSVPPSNQQPYNTSSDHRSNQYHSASHTDNRNRHHHDHGHSHHHNLPFKVINGSNFKVVDADSKRPNGITGLQNTQNPSNSYPSNSYPSNLYPSNSYPPAIYNQSSLLPPLRSNYSYGLYSPGYYGTQPPTDDWKTSSYRPKMYKSNVQTKFYDRYLNDVIDKRLFT